MSPMPSLEHFEDFSELVEVLIAFYRARDCHSRRFISFRSWQYERDAALWTSSALLDLLKGEALEERFRHMQGRHRPLMLNSRGDNNTLAPSCRGARKPIKVGCCRVLEAVDCEAALEISRAIVIALPSEDVARCEEVSCLPAWLPA